MSYSNATVAARTAALDAKVDTLIACVRVIAQRMDSLVVAGAPAQVGASAQIAALLPETAQAPAQDRGMFSLSGAALKGLAQAGNAQAQAEIDRRAAKHAGK